VIAAYGTLPRPPPGSGIDTREEIIRYWQGQSVYPATGCGPHSGSSPGMS
jgi:hypothetical protein